MQLTGEPWTFVQLQTNGNVDQVLKKSIEDLEKKRKEDVQPIMPNMVMTIDANLRGEHCICSSNARRNCSCR